MEITPLILQRMLADAAELGARQALEGAGLVKPWISRSEAYRRYGERTVKRWIREGKVKPQKPTPSAVKTFLSVKEMELLSKSFKPIYVF